MTDGTIDAAALRRLEERAKRFSWIWDEPSMAAPCDADWQDLSVGHRRLLNLLCAGSREAANPAMPSAGDVAVFLMLGRPDIVGCDWWHAVDDAFLPYPNRAQPDTISDEDVEAAAKAGLLSPIGRHPGRRLSVSTAGAAIWRRACEVAHPPSRTSSAWPMQRA